VANELYLSEHSDLSSPAVTFAGSEAIYPSEDTYQNNLLITHIPTFSGKGILQKKANDYRLFTVTFPALTNSDFSTMLTALDGVLYTTSSKEYYFGTTAASNYALPYTYSSGDIRTIQVRLINIEKQRIPNSYGRLVFNLILTFQRVG